MRPLTDDRSPHDPGEAADIPEEMLKFELPEWTIRMLFGGLVKHQIDRLGLKTDPELIEYTTDTLVEAWQKAKER